MMSLTSPTLVLLVASSLGLSSRVLAFRNLKSTGEEELAFPWLFSRFFGAPSAGNLQLTAEPSIADTSTPEPSMAAPLSPASTHEEPSDRLDDEPEGELKPPPQAEEELGDDLTSQPAAADEELRDPPASQPAGPDVLPAAATQLTGSKFFRERRQSTDIVAPAALTLRAKRGLQGASKELDWTSSVSRVTKVMAAVRPVLDELVSRYNISVQVGFADSSGSQGVAAGVDNVWTGKLLTPSTRIPVGSAMKPITAIHVMKAVEEGRIGLDDLASTWVDGHLQRGGNTSLGQLFGPSVDNITIRHLLAMTSGLPDYNDREIKRRHIRNPGQDIDPFFYLRSAAKMRKPCRPGACAWYSGANYVLLGFVLLELQGAQRWEDLNQTAVIPPELKAAGRYKNLDFAMRGSCAQYPNVAHQIHSYMRGDRRVFRDMHRHSCLNGWSMGNVLATAEDLSQLWFDLFTYKLVKKESLQTMMQFTPMKNRWCKGCSYGLGLQRVPQAWRLAHRSDRPRVGIIELEGHNGMNYGSMAKNCGYNPAFAFGMCIEFTSTSGRNCRDVRNAAMGRYSTCRIYDAMLSVVGGPRLKCRRRRPKRSSKPCLWAHVRR